MVPLVARQVGLLAEVLAALAARVRPPGSVRWWIFSYSPPAEPFPQSGTRSDLASRKSRAQGAGGRLLEPGLPAPRPAQREGLTLDPQSGPGAPGSRLPTAARHGGDPTGRKMFSLSSGKAACVCSSHWASPCLIFITSPSSAGRQRDRGQGESFGGC